MRPLFVAGAHTDVGKTHAACQILSQARARGLSVEALKPVISGFDPARPVGSDSWRLIEACGAEPTAEALAHVSPWRFAAPLAPPMAARAEGRELPYEDVLRLCGDRLRTSAADLLLVESAGGLMSPIAWRGTCFDLAADLDLETVLVGGSYLGAISHTLTAVEVLRAAGVVVAAVVISESADPDAPDFAQTVEQVRLYAPDSQVLALPRNGEVDFVANLGLA